MENYFIFFRLWPGFSEPFPFDRFDGIAKDDELLQALNSWAREEIRRPEARQAIMQVARWRKQEWLAATQKRRGMVASRPGRFPRDTSRRSPGTEQLTERDLYWPRIRQPERPEPLVCRFGFDLGWWRQVGDDSFPFPFGPRVWFYEVPSSELAEIVVSALNNRTDLNFDDHKWEYYLQPRFGFVEDTDVALRISARRCIKSISQGKIPEVRSGEMAMAMGPKAISLADEILEAATPPMSTDNPNEGEENTGTDSMPRKPVASENATVKNTATVEPKLTIEKWSNLGIGIDADGKYLGVSPCPERYGVFPRKQAVILDLRGSRWKKILDILARSKHGNTAKKSEVMQQFGYIQSGEISPDDIPELAKDSQKIETLNQARNSLTSAIADLGRELRSQVNGPTDKGAPAVLSVASEREVQAAFFVRHLVRGHDGKLRFGENPVDRC